MKRCSKTKLINIAYKQTNCHASEDISKYHSCSVNTIDVCYTNISVCEKLLLRDTRYGVGVPLMYSPPVVCLRTTLFIWSKVIGKATSLNKNME